MFNFPLLPLILLWRSQKVGLLKQIVVQIRDIRARAGEAVVVHDDLPLRPLDDDGPEQEEPGGKNKFDNYHRV